MEPVINHSQHPESYKMQIKIFKLGHSQSALFSGESLEDGSKKGRTLICSICSVSRVMLWPLWCMVLTTCKIDDYFLPTWGQMCQRCGDRFLIWFLHRFLRADWNSGWNRRHVFSSRENWPLFLGLSAFSVFITLCVVTSKEDKWSQSPCNDVC